MNNDHPRSEEHDAVDELLELLKNIPKNRVTMLNLPRYSKAIQSIKSIVKYVKDDCPDAEVNVYFDELTGTSLCLTIIADELNVYRVKEFCAAIESASTMCVIPRLDSCVEIGFTFEDAQVPVKPDQQ